MKLVKFYPNNGQLRRSESSMNNFYNMWDSFLNEDYGLSNYQSPKVNVIEEDDKFILEMAVPGIKKENIQLNVEKDILKVSHNENQESTEKAFNRIEFSYSSFERNFKLSESIDVDNIEAKMENGILTITLLKKEEAKEKPKREIAIS